jgi:hypothetical protein
MIESSWLHNERCSGWQTAQTLLLLVFFLVRRVAEAVPLLIPGRCPPAFRWPSFLNLKWIPWAIMEKRGFTTDRAAVGVVMGANEQKRGCRPEKLVMTSKFDGH